MEPPLQCRVLLDVPPVLVWRRRADHLQLAAREGGLHDVGGVDAALRRPGPDDRVKLVDEQDDVPSRLLHLIDDRLEALLELAELGPGHDPRHVQRQHPLAAQRLRNVLRDDALSESFRNRRLADACVADDDGVVLRATGQCLHDAPYLGAPANHRVELALARQTRQINGVALQRLIAALGARIGHPAPAPHPLERLVSPLLVHAMTHHDARGLALLVRKRRDEEVLGAYVLVAETLRLILRDLQQRQRAGRRVYLIGLIGESRCLGESRLNLGADSAGIHAKLPQHLYGDAPFVLEQREHDVLHVPLRVLEAAHDVIARADNVLRLFREVVLLENHRLYSPLALSLIPAQEPRILYRLPSRSSSSRTCRPSSAIRACIRMITSTPARLIPKSSMSDLIHRARWTSHGENMRMLPRDRAGSSRPMRS